MGGSISYFAIWHPVPKAVRPRTASLCAVQLATLLSMLCLTGCHTLWQRNRFLEQSARPNTSIPHELAKTTLPSYRIEAPDILLIDAVKIVPKEPYVIEALDLLTILVEGTPEESPILGEYRVDASGGVNLGPGYGRVVVEGLTLDEAETKIQEHLLKILATAETAVSLAEPAARQVIEGEHIVSQDGSISLGIYGTTRVVGLTVAQAREAIEKHLSQYLEDPEVAVDVSAYNSKSYYIILQGAGQGDQVNKFPITGNETVLDALGQVDLTPNQSTNMWIARPAPAGSGCDQMLPVDWTAICQGGSTATNYQIMPGDRLFIAEDKLVAFGSVIAKVTAPFERMFGAVLLGTQTVQQINRSPTGYRGSSGVLAASALAGT